MPAPDTDAALLQTLLAVSSLQTALAVRHAADERRAGRDPSDQEGPDVVRPYLDDARAELQNMAHRLRAAFAYAPGEDEEAHGAGVVRRFDALLTLRALVELLGTVHRRLLSLYPAVAPEVVEASRRLHGRSRGLLDADAEETDVAGLVDEALAFAVTLERALARG